MSRNGHNNGLQSLLFALTAVLIMLMAYAAEHDKELDTVNPTESRDYCGPPSYPKNCLIGKKLI